MSVAGFEPMISVSERRKVQIMKFTRYLIFLYNRVFSIPSNPKGATLFSAALKKKVKLLHSRNTED